MLQKPRLKQNFTACLDVPGVLFLLDEHTQMVFEGEMFTPLVPLLDGRHTLPELIGKIGAQGSATRPMGQLIGELYGALRQLAVRGCLVEGEPRLSRAQTAFWDAAGVSAEPLEALRVSVRAVGGLGVEAVADMEAALGLAGVLTVPVGEQGDFTRFDVVVTDDYLAPGLESVNRAQLDAHQPWVLVKPVGMVVYIGPIFRPGETACWRCLEHRLRANRQIEGFIRERSDAASPAAFELSKAKLPSSVKAGAALAAVELARSLVQHDLPSAPMWRGQSWSPLDGCIRTLDLSRMAYEAHRVMKRPQCRACGEGPAALVPRPITLQSRVKPAGATADHRTSTAQETFERFAHHISPITGAVTALNTRERGHRGLVHNFVTGHYFPVLTDDVSGLRLNRIARSGGKGATEIQAKTSALCEALERYAGIYWGDEQIVTARASTLGDDAISIEALALYSEAQYQQRLDANASAQSEHQFVPHRAEGDPELGWAKAWSLTDARFRHLPASYCYYGYHDAGRFYCYTDSNGCAAGNTLEEAILQGFLEVAERDAVAVWWYNRLRRPAVDVSSFGLPYWHKLETHYRNDLGRDLHVLDLTHDLGVPTFGVVSRRESPARAAEDIVLGFAAHLDARTALRRALWEANQYLPALCHDKPDGSTAYRVTHTEAITWWKTATYETQPYVVADPDAPIRRASDFEPLVSDDLKTDVETCVRLARARGLEVLIVDQTRPDLELPVARVVVPGMRHFWRRLAPGRLYDVPVEMGWLPAPKPEAQMNPIACFV